MAKRAREFWESAKYNNASFNQYYDRLTELALSAFEWKNVPDTVDIRNLELALFAQGQCVFFEDEVLGFLCLRNVGSGPFDINNIPIYRRAYAPNGYTRDLDPNNSVIIFNNLLRKPSAPDVQMMAARLWDFDQIISMNARAQKTPILIRCDENERLSLKNVYMQYDGNQPVIYGNKSLNPDSMQVLTTNAPYIGAQIYNLKQQYWNEALMYLGVPNASSVKRANLTTVETTGAMGSTFASRYSRLEARRTACEQINKMFGLNMSVDFRFIYQESESGVPDFEPAEDYEERGAPPGPNGSPSPKERA